MRRFHHLAAAVTLFIAVLLVLPGDAAARGGLGGYHGEGFHLAGVSVANPGAVSMGSYGGVHTGSAYGRVHFHPSVGYYHPSSQPIERYSPGLGRFQYNQLYANPDAYRNPYMVNPYNPYHVPFAHPF